MLRQVSGGAARPIIVRPMMSDTPPSSPSGGVSPARPPLSPSPATAGAPSVARRGTASTLSDVVGAGLQPLRVQLIAVATSVDDLVDSVRDVLVKVAVISRSQERLAQAVHTMGTTFTVGFKDVLSALEEMSNAADGRVSSPSSAADQTLTAISTLNIVGDRNHMQLNHTHCMALYFTIFHCNVLQHHAKTVH